ncbi:hypothetical protein PIB30_014490 [Stylosanthes scabra]|uniref:MADS-box domain-containing protein n=1 Tax=Stylosanthes scabra TaxID=79078 RepID=A0ABU6X4P1_9FABA|nr:hypothetical protein [Stylosanthes scabra]
MASNNNNSSSNSKKNKGRQKIEMKKMTKESNLQVTFSKRRGGLFKKASELSTLCGVDVALIVFSPGNKAYSFGHPSVESLIESFIESGGPPPHLDSSAAVHHHFVEEHDDLNALLMHINDEIEAERKLLEEMNRMRKEAERKWWWAAPIDEMSAPKLNEYKAALEELKKSVTCHFEKRRGQDNHDDPATVVAAAVMSSNSNNMVPVVPVPMLPMPLPPIFFSSLFQNSHSHHQMHNNNNNNNYHHQRYEDESPYQFYSYTAMMQGGGSPFGPYTTARNNSGF